MTATPLGADRFSTEELRTLLLILAEVEDGPGKEWLEEVEAELCFRQEQARQEQALIDEVLYG